MRLTKTLALMLLLGGFSLTSAAQTPVEAVESKLTAIKADADAVLARNATLSKRSKLPLWVSDAQARIVAGATAALLEVAQWRVRFGPVGAAAGCDATAANLTRATVQTFLTDVAITAGTEGDPQVYCLPAGSETWPTQVTWSAPAYTVLKGAGSLSTLGGGDTTVIVDGYDNDGPVLDITTNATGTFRFAGMSVRGGTLTGTKYKNEGMVRFQGTSTQFRVDHVTFDFTTYVNASSANSIKLRGCIAGVIDSSVFENQNAFVVHRNGCDAGGEGDSEWAAATDFGSADFLFFEDNEVNPLTQYGSMNDCYHAGKWVIRYNVSNGAGVQTHPTGGSGRARGCRASEFYGNTLNAPPTSTQFNAFFLSSGPSLIWGNVAAASKYSNFVTLHSMRRNNSTYSQTATPDGWGYCGTSFNGTGSNWDQNTSASTGYACMDQPGRGQGDLLRNSFPTAENADTSSISWPEQALEPVYAWRNTWSQWESGKFMAVYETDAMIANQDFYTDANNDTGATITFNGTVGMGFGVIASRPATCTTGVAYVATDEGRTDVSPRVGSITVGKMYVCTATNTWTARYGGHSSGNASGLPYTYPHPLRTP